jgi:hypothetical protein
VTTFGIENCVGGGTSEYVEYSLRVSLDEGTLYLHQGKNLGVYIQIFAEPCLGCMQHHSLPVVKRNIPMQLVYQILSFYQCWVTWFEYVN